MGKIILSCGHEDAEKPLGWHFHAEEWVCDEEGQSKAILSGTACSRCFAARVLQYPRKTWLNYEEAMEAIFGKNL